jgi:hypothetical protein
LAVWLKRMGEAVAAKADPKEIEALEAELTQAKTAVTAGPAATADTFGPLRLPKTSEEEKELEEIAVKDGPRANSL